MRQGSLSPFHREILEYLRNISSRTYELDAPVSHYELLLQQVGWESMATEALHSSLSQNVEWELMESFPVSELADLTRDVPQMYRGLPRLFNRNKISQSRIKEGFGDLPSLRRRVALRPLFALYAHTIPKGRVCIVHGSSQEVGAWAAHCLRSQFSDLSIEQVGLDEQLLPDADLILQMPSSLADLLGRKGAQVERIGDLGMGELFDFRPESNGYPMGLHFLEMGLPIQKLKQAKWDQVESEEVQQWKSQDAHFYFADLKSSLGGAIYLHALLKSLEKDEGAIDLCVSQLDWFIKYLEEQKRGGGAFLQWDLGVKDFEVRFGSECFHLNIASEGKRVRILCPKDLSRFDFQRLLSLSKPFVAVSSTQALSAMIAMGKPFFLDACSGKLQFVKDLLALAENRIRAFPATLECLRAIHASALYQWPPQDGQWVDETFFQERLEWSSIALGLGFSLQDPDIANGFKQLGQIVATEFSANRFLTHLVQRAFCHRTSPQVAALESELLHSFSLGEQTFSQIVGQINRCLG